MKAEILSIGTELLLGHILNTNAPFISQKLAEIGIDVYYQTTVGDNPARLSESIKKALLRSDIVIMTGGLGPTVDDVTMQVISDLIQKPLVLNKTILKDLEYYFKLRGVKMPRESIRQAYIPEGIKWIRNTFGAAPSLIVEYEGKLILCLPGPPRECEPMFVKDIIPYLRKISKTSWAIRSLSIKITGLGESQVNEKTEDLLKLKPPTMVGIYAKLGEVTLKIMSKAKSASAADRAIKAVEKKIHARLKGHIFGHDSDTLEGAVSEILFKKKLTIAAAESCTGGLLSSRLTNISGSSKYFMMGAITYSNRSKINILGIPEEDIRKYGAVSEQVARQMAKRVRSLAHTDIGIGITGIAGPTGGTKAKPVGLVYIALSINKKELVEKMIFRGSREEIKFQASQTALDLIRQNI